MPSARSILIRKIFEIRDNARMSAEQFQAMKLAKFRQLVRHASASSPYYAQLIRERNIDIERCTPADFPPLTKAILMAEFDRIVTDRRITKRAIADFLTRSHDPTERFLKEFRVIHTSGSSGEVGYFVYSPADWARGSAQALRPRRGRNRVQRRRRFARFRIAYYGAIGGHFAGITMMRGAAQGIGRLFMKAAFYEVNNPLPETIAALKPDLLVKGADYTMEEVVGAETVRAEGGRVLLLPLMRGQSTTSLIRRAADLEESRRRPESFQAADG